jgi:hypothetical protein
MSGDNQFRIAERATRLRSPIRRSRTRSAVHASGPRPSRRKSPDRGFDECTKTILIELLLSRCSYPGGLYCMTQTILVLPPSHHPVQVYLVQAIATMEIKPIFHVSPKPRASLYVLC